MSFARTQHSASSDARTSDPSILVKHSTVGLMLLVILLFLLLLLLLEIHVGVQ